MENKNEGKENKIILRDFNCTMDKVDRYGGNKIQRLYRCCSYYILIVDKGLEDPDSLEFNCYDRSFGKDPVWARSILIQKLPAIARIIT